MEKSKSGQVEYQSRLYSLTIGEYISCQYLISGVLSNVWKLVTSDDTDFNVSTYSFQGLTGEVFPGPCVHLPEQRGSLWLLGQQGRRHGFNFRGDVVQGGPWTRV